MAILVIFTFDAFGEPIVSDEVGTPQSIAGMHSANSGQRPAAPGHLTGQLNGPAESVFKDGFEQFVLLSIGKPTIVTTSVPGENVSGAFTGTAGQKLTLATSDNTFNGGVTLTIRQPSGEVIASLTVSTPSGWHDVFTLPVTGTYSVTIDPAGPQTGTVTLLLAPVPDNTGSTAIGVPTTVVTTVPGENPSRTFAATAGQKLTLATSDNTFTGGVTLTIRQPLGEAVASLTVFTPSGWHDVFTLPVTGTYTITIDPAGPQTGTVTVLLAPVPDNTGSTAIGAPTTVTTTAPGENPLRTFAGTAGQKLTLAISDNTFNGGVTLTIRQPSGEVIASLTLPMPSGWHDVFTLPVTGTYSVTIDPAGPQTGTVTFLLAAVPDNTGSTAIGSPTTVTTTVPGENPLRTFAATAGQKLTLATSDNTFDGGVTLTIRQPSGEVVASLTVFTPSGALDAFTLPVTGTYSVSIDPAGPQTGTVTFLLAPVPDNAGSSASVRRWSSAFNRSPPPARETLR